MASSRGDHAPQTVSCSDRQPSQTVSCSDRQPSQTVSCSDRQPVQDNDYLARCQQQARYTYTLPPGVSSAGLSEMEIARGDFYLRPNDCYTKRQQDLMDMDEDVGREDDWTWLKADGGDLQTDDSFRSVESPHTLGDGPTPPPPPPYREPPSPRYRGPPDDPTRNRGCTDVPPPSPRPLPPVPEPPSQARIDWEEFRLDWEELERYFTSKSDAEIPDQLRELMTKCWNSGEKFSRASPDNGRTIVTQPLDYPLTQMDVRQRCTLWTALSPSEDHVDHKRYKDARTIANAHLSAAANPQIRSCRVDRQLLDPQLSRGSSGATSSQGEQQTDLIRRPAQPPPPLPSERDVIRRPAQPPPPLPSERDLSRRPAQPPPPLPPPCYCLEHFSQCTRITTHWTQHSDALQRFRAWCRSHGLTSLVLDSWNDNIVQKKPNGFAGWSADCPTWSWDGLLAQLNDDSLRRIVEGTHGADGIVACMVRESSFVDGRKRSAADQTTRTGNVKEVLYHWEFAFLRNNGTVAFLRPSPISCSIQYYEGVPIGESAVATQNFRNVTTDAMSYETLAEFHFGDEGVITCRLDKPNARYPKNWFPNMSSLKLETIVGIKFMEHRYANYATRGSASRPPPR